MKYRKFTQEFERLIVEHSLSDTEGPTELCKYYNVFSGLFYRWKKQYVEGQLHSEPSKKAELAARIRGLMTMPMLRF